jgi:hypothetical protein
MAKELAETIQEDAQGPAEVSGDSGSMKQDSPKKQVETDRYGARHTLSCLLSPSRSSPPPRQPKPVPAFSGCSATSFAANRPVLRNQA